MKKFRLIDHTGDLGVEIFGGSLDALFRHAGEAFTDIVSDAKTVGTAESKRISLQADRTDDLLIRWLNEFVFLFDTHGFLPASFEIASIDERHIDAQVRGETYDANRHPIKTTIKGATYHQLEVVRRKDGQWKARVIFDL